MSTEANRQPRILDLLSGKVALIGLGFAAFFWVLESVIHTAIFHEGDFLEQIIRPHSHEIWMRLIVGALFIALGVCGQIMVNVRRRAEEAIRQAYTELDQVFNTAADGMRIVDRDFTVLKVNETFAALSGIKEGPVVGKKCFETLSGPLCHTPNCPLTRILAGEARVECDVEKVRSDGTVVPCILTATPFRDPNGRLIGVVEDFRDITQRMLARQAAGQAHAELNQIFETAADGMRLIDRDFNILRVNETFAALAGMDRNEAIGKKCYEVFPGHLCRSSNCPLTRILNGEERMEFDAEKTRRDGTVVPCIITATPFLDQNGRMIGIVEDFKDITERKHTEEILKSKTNELTRSNAELEQFAYIASHDLQEPLRVMSSYLQLLERRYKESLDAKAQEFITRAVDASARMKLLIDDLLAYSRLSTRAKPFELTDFNEALRKSLADLEISIRDNGVIVTSDRLPAGMADGSQILQLFQNLLSNAIKFRNPSQPRIHIGAKRADGEWLFFVRDNGIGIDMEYADRIFEVFQRLHTRSEYPGTGIGLAICKKVVERHGGRIWVESEPGQGSAFFFTIPGRMLLQ
ncbi:MAG: PAS domain S-box protein [Pseudomonadota bacterium]